MKPSLFNLFTPGWIQDTVLGFNTFTGSFITLSPERFQRARELLLEPGAGGGDDEASAALRDVLVAGGFLVPDDADEHAAVEARYFKARSQRRGVSLTIAPTIACNLRCTYCFEEHPNKKMSQKDLDLTLDFVRRSLEDDTSLGVVWFGGEPMLAVDQIVAFAPVLQAEARRRRCTYNQSLITNGVLFTPENARKLHAVGPFDSVQITLDGPPRVHDPRRGTVAGAGTFERILENVVASADLFHIQIRVNVDRTTYTHLPELVQILTDAGLRGKVHVYLGHAYSYANTAGHLGSSQLDIEEFAHVDAQFKLHLFQRGFLDAAPLPAPQIGAVCVADNPQGAVIAPGGNVFKCWNETAMPASRAVGNLGARPEEPAPGDTAPRRLKVGYHDEHAAAQRVTRDGWEQYSPFTQSECKTCVVRPLCVAGCPWEVRQRPSTEGPGHCTPLKFNVADTLRLHHLVTSLRQSVTGTPAGAGPVDACRS